MDPPDIKVDLQDSLTEEFQIKPDIVDEECEINAGIVEEESKIKTEIEVEQKCQDKIKIEEEQILQIKTYILEKNESLLQEVIAAPQDPFEPTLFQGPLDEQAKIMVINVHKYFRKLKLIRARATGLGMDVNSCVAEATGVSLYKVNKIRKWYREIGIEWSLKQAHNRNNCSKKKH